MQSQYRPPSWPIDGGIAGELIRQFDWSRTSLGPLEHWPSTLRTMVNSMVNSPIPQVLMWGSDNVMLYNDGYIEIAGSYHPRALGGTVSGIWPEIWDWNRRILEEGFQGKVQSFTEQTLTLHRHGKPEDVIFDLYYTPVYSDDGRQVEGVLCTVLEITEAVEARAELAASRSEMSSLTDALPILVGFMDCDLIFRLANGRYLDVFGVPPEQVIGRHKREIVGEAYFASREPSLQRALAGETVIGDAPVTLPDGTVHTFEVRYIPRRDPKGQVVGLYVLMVDVEDRKRAAEDLRRSNQRFAAAVEAIHGVLWTNSPDGRMEGEQAGWASLTGQSYEEYQGYGWASAVHPDDQIGSVESWQRAVETKSTYTWEHRVRSRDGSWRNFAIRAIPTLDQDGSIREWVGVHTDITEQRAAEAQLVERAIDLERQVRHRKCAEQQLRELNEGLEARVEAEIAERRKAERTLQQAQKMDAIGQLTGGVAHDFNNLLQVVSGNLQLLARDVAGNPGAEQKVANALSGVQRGAKLASQLLAFGRRQALEPRVIHVGKLVTGMDDMLRRTIGEAVEVEVAVSRGLWNTCVDPGQVENVLLNLAINARDAMDGNGRLTIEVGNATLDKVYGTANPEVVPGEYVMLAVSDTGVGMTPDILDKVFEPFFSTKPESRGTGLGLSMVYGFVKQSSGHVSIYSEPGIGTTVKVFLPRSLGEEDHDPQPRTGPVLGGTETILVVEDDEAVRDTVVQLLTELGYHVLTAKDPQAGLSVVESGVPIDVLFTDVVMPGPLTSREMARRSQSLIPGLAVLFTSGYTENSIVHGGRLDEGVELLSKPYSHEALARRLRHVIANARQAAQASGAPRPGPTAAMAEAGTDDEQSGPAPLRILLVEDNFLICADTAMLIEDMGHKVRQANSAKQALTAFEEEGFDLLLTDLGLPDLSGDELARQVLEKHPRLAIVYPTGEGSLPVGSPARAVLLVKPYSENEIREAIDQAMAAARA
ncbi:PAS domain-containing protein [Paracoccus sp. MBLB3053]|uniref:histidine kinase n=1 Tax=Paracoccus aurantius TaxID=3073814 RepID=A0ABU2HWS4_9RHOB|nr:PAS domain-containing protein [Paracoccus sp. MBLB3053]MDS9469059.1 PAS domain-containing protein [Paracoccus sp. MBLB3053]